MQGLTWKEWRESLSLVGLRNEDVIVLLRAFIDDSSDRHQKVLTVSGAVASTYRQWSKLRIEWNKRLKRDGLRYFKSSEYSVLRGEFSVFADPNKYPKPLGREAANLLRLDLEEIVHRIGVIGVSTCVPIQTYQEFRAVVPGAAEVFNEDPAESALYSVVHECVLMMQEDFPGSKIAFVCDSTSAQERFTKVYFEYLRRHAPARDVIHGALLPHLDDKKHPPLQVADMMASISREMATRYLQNPESPTPIQRLEGSIYKICTWNWDWMMDTLRKQPHLVPNVGDVIP
jgi:hypothetical protein